MGKYEPLTRHLEGIEGESWEADFAQIERVLGFKLPDSAYEYQAWWANQTGAGHSQTRGWQDAGFETRNLDLAHRKVRFERQKHRPQSSPAKLGRLSELWANARSLTGIEDRDSLIEAALMALVQREAGRMLVELGGSMPDLVVPERERPTW